MESDRPILVTGTHRSGSTWVGRMIAASPRTGYIQEPFNPKHDRGIFAAAVERHFTYVSLHNEWRYEAALRDTIAFRYRLGADTNSTARKSFYFWRTSLLYRLQGRRPLLKDPLALFAAEWIAAKFNAQVVVVIRHPAAFASSMLKAGWASPLEELLGQPRFFTGHLAGFEREARQLVGRGTTNIVERASLFWRIAHSEILRYRKEHPDWLFVRHEDLSLDPVAKYEAVFDFLGLKYTGAVRKKIHAYTKPGNPVERADETWPAAARLDSRENLNRWCGRLKPTQVAMIREECEYIWREFYTDEDWAAAEGYPASVSASL